MKPPTLTAALVRVAPAPLRRGRRSAIFDTVESFDEALMKRNTVRAIDRSDAAALRLAFDLAEEP